MLRMILVFFAVLLLAGCFSADEDNSETSDGDTPSLNATELTMDSTEEFTLEADQDVRWFKIPVSSESLYTLTLYNTPASSSTIRLQAFDSDQAPIDSQRSVVTGRERNIEVETPTDIHSMYIRVQGNSHAFFRFELTASEGNSAIPLELNTLDQEFTLNSRHRERWFKFPASEDKQYAVDLLNVSSNSGFVRAQAYDADRNPIGSRRSALRNRMASLEIRDQSDTLFILVDGSATSDYRFQVTPLVRGEFEHDDVTFEPNNTMTAAYTAEINARYTATLDRSNALDWYLFDVVAGDELTLSVDHDSGSGLGHLDAQFHDAAGDPLGSRLSLLRGASGERVVHVTESGELYLRISFDHPTSYSFETQVVGVSSSVEE